MYYYEVFCFIFDSFFNSKMVLQSSEQEQSPVVQNELEHKFNFHLGCGYAGKKKRTSPIPSLTCQRVMFWMWMMNGNESIAFGKLHIKIIEDY